MEIDWADRLIAEQQGMSVATLEALRAHGVIEDVTLLRLDFHYEAPGESQAEMLANFLTQSTDYEVAATPRRSRFGLRRAWSIDGQTQETPVSSSILNDWIEWMVLAGAENGECRFDGWGPGGHRLPDLPMSGRWKSRAAHYIPALRCSHVRSERLIPS